MSNRAPKVLDKRKHPDTLAKEHNCSLKTIYRRLKDCDDYVYLINKQKEALSLPVLGQVYNYPVLTSRGIGYIISNSGKVVSQILNSEELYQVRENIIKETEFLNILNPTLIQRIAVIREQITEIPRCPVCGNYLNFSTRPNQLFAKTCEGKCKGLLDNSLKII